MTDKRDLKRRIRERQAKTGESYMAARAQVLARAQPKPANPPFPVVEMIDVSAQAGELRMRCRAILSSSLAERIDPRVVLIELRVLLAESREPDLDRMRTLVLAGRDVDVLPRETEPWRQPLRRFAALVHSGVPGVSECGTLVSYPVPSTAQGDELLVVAQAGVPRSQAGKPGARSHLVLRTAEELVWSEIMVSALKFRYS